MEKKKEKVISLQMMDKLASILEAKYKKVTLWGDEENAFIECKGFSGPSKKVEKIIADLGLRITEQLWSAGSDYSGYYYWVAE